jgi:hypothetical protein
LAGKDASDSGKAVQPRQDTQHLDQSIVPIGATPRFLHCLDVLGFRYGGAETVGGSEEDDGWDVMDHGVLARQRDCNADTGSYENVTVGVEGWLTKLLRQTNLALQN